MKPKLLDLFCGAGGAAMGYYRAGFDVVGVDIEQQKHYPFEFHQADALEYCAEHGHEFDVIHASPPCQKYSVMTNGRWQDRLDSHLDLIVPTREMLKSTGKPYIIENVSGARRQLINPLMLCGTMFNLGSMGAQLRRHRYFECSFPVSLTPPCQHNKASAIGVYGGGQHPKRRKTIGVYGNAGGHSIRDNYKDYDVNARIEAMQIDWMTGKELSEAIPPAYTEFIGRNLLEQLREWKGDFEKARIAQFYCDTERLQSEEES